MRNKDTGEFELIVGDKQLLTGFFIGMLLLGVVFAMGYVLGQNSPKSAKVAADTTAAVPTPTITTETRAPHPTSVPVLTPPDSTSAAMQPDAQAATPVEPPPQPSTVPARETSAAAPPKTATEPANAAYWQVIATASVSAADKMFQTLKSQGFPASTRTGPNNLTVVWVGPYTDKDSLIKAKKQLEDAGLTNIIQKKP